MADKNNENMVERRIKTAKVMTELGADIKTCITGIKENTKTTKDLLIVLHGKDKEGGLITQVALNKQSISRVRKWVGSIGAAVVAWIMREVFFK